MMCIALGGGGEGWMTWSLTSPSPWGYYLSVSLLPLSVLGGLLFWRLFQPLRFKVAEMRKAHPISFISPKSEEFEWMGAGPGR